MTTTLGLDPRFRDAVLDGSKSTTVRMGRRTIPAGPAQFQCGEVIIPIQVVNSRVLKARELNDLDARRDGFGDLDRLWAALRQYYPDLTPNDEVTIIAYELL